MGVSGIEALVFGVDDMAAADRFWTDFGLEKVEDTPQSHRFAAANGSQVVLRSAGDPALPAAITEGPTAREVVWGVSDAADLDAIAARLSPDHAFTRDADGTLRTTDPTGQAIALRFATTRPVTPEAPRFNVPGKAERVDARGRIYTRARPQYLSHVVFRAPNLNETYAFYRDRLGFRLSDSYKDQGYFLRGGASHEHHNLFLLKAGDDRGFHHVAFELADIHELFGGGLYMSRQGWPTHLGPGRHPISSCYFWYFKTPCGGAAEYDWDSDYVTEDWQPREWPRTPEVFAEWALEHGMHLYGGVQTGRS